MNFAKETRGFRNNNPGNIDKGVGYVGEKAVSTDSRFAQFDSVDYGIRAIGKLLGAYRKKGFNTITKVINRYAPSTENNTEAYISAVEKAVKVKRDGVLTDAMIPAFVASIIAHENGFNPFSTAFIERCLALT